MRRNPPSSWDEASVLDFNNILTALQTAEPDKDFSGFRVPPGELASRVTGFTRGTRRAPGQTFYSSKLYCEDGPMTRRLEGVAAYLAAVDPASLSPVATSKADRVSASIFDLTGAIDMPFGTLATENLRVFPQNGDAPIPTKGRVAGSIILINDARVPLRVGDVVERSLPSGIVERFVITDPGYHETVGHGIPSHYQAKFLREDAAPIRKPSSAIHVTGDHARINVGSVDQSTNLIQHLGASGKNDELASELRTLRLELLSKAGDVPERYSAIGAVATAESAATEGDEAKAATGLRTLGKAGTWVLKTATDLGLPLATAYIKAHLGL